MVITLPLAWIWAIGPLAAAPDKVFPTLPPVNKGGSVVSKTDPVGIKSSRAFKSSVEPSIVAGLISSLFKAGLVADFTISLAAVPPAGRTLVVKLELNEAGANTSASVSLVAAKLLPETVATNLRPAAKTAGVTLLMTPLALTVSTSRRLSYLFTNGTILKT